MTYLGCPSSLAFRRTAVASAAALFAFALAHAQPASSHKNGAEISLALDGAATSRADFTARGASAGGVAVTQAGMKLKVPLPPLNSKWFPSVGLNYQHYELDRSPGTPLPDRLKSLSASFTVVGVSVAEWIFIGSAGPDRSRRMTPSSRKV